ncbi:hypothetical protein M1B72_18045 [Geomonas paludis]|uniref:Uncharacterized protein n=1 Tax=Geomonas paludis TaxID=2740185 RepID=A0A6V8MSU4_9BACT|nr:hypothetical protein [Geomonas paludis]UPU35325.1 hypothetical protein M1B72_18045 [Geomonas paludis]GFO63112.1 hypothetical protein GMPD_10310 [Geomonas paludis]
MPFSNVPHADMIGKSAVIAQALTPELHAYLVSLFPTPASITELYLKYETSFAASLKGDPEKVKACEADREALDQAIGLLFGLGKAAHRKDPTILGQLGFGTAKKPAGTGKPVGKPVGFHLSFGNDGKPWVALTRISSAKGYEVWTCNGDPGNEQNWKFLVWSTTCKKILLSGINRSVPNFLRVRGKRGDIVGPWSNWIALDPV